MLAVVDKVAALATYNSLNVLLSSLSVEDVEELLAYEDGHRNRHYVRRRLAMRINALRSQAFLRKVMGDG